MASKRSTKRHALMVQIGFDLEIRRELEGQRVAVLQIAAELPLQRRFRKIGDVRGHARHRQTLGRLRAVQLIFAALPVGIGHDRLAAHFVERDVLRGMARGAGDRHRRAHALGIGRRPLQHLHAAHRAADDAQQLLDAQRVEQHGLRAHHVADGDQRKIAAP